MSTNNQYIKYTITITQNSQNVSGNYSSISVSVRFFRINTGYTTYGSGTIYCKIDGSTYSSSVSSSQKITSDGIVLFSRSQTVYHNSDGSKTLTCSAWVSMDVVSSNEQSYSMGLSTIPRASSFSGGSGNIGSSTTITISRASSSFNHTLYYDVGSGWISFASKVGTSYSWTIPSALYSKIPNSNSGSGTLYCETYNGSSYIGSSSRSFSFYVTNSNPTFSSSQLSYYDNDSSVVAITGNNQWIVQNKSTFYASFTSATAKNSASISSYQVTFNGKAYNYSSSGTKNLGTVNSSNNLTLSVKAIDSRGNYTTISKTVTCFGWQTPTATIAASRKNNFENESYLTVNALISSVNGTNSIQTLQYRYKKTTDDADDDSSYSDWIDIENGTKTTISIDNVFAWNFQVQLSDKFATNSYDFIIAKGMPILFFDTKKISVGINTFPVNSNSFETSNLYVDGMNLSFDTIYPVDSIYMSVNATNPSVYFGGSWSLWGSGRVPVCVNTSDGDFSYSERTGGAKTVTLSTSQIPSHTHTVYENIGDGRQAAFGGHYSSTGGSNIFNTSVRGTTNDETTNIIKAANTGGGSSHNNLQPFICCYMWKRVE